MYDDIGRTVYSLEGAGGLDRAAILVVGALRKRTITPGFRGFRSGSGAHVSEGRWSDGSISRPSSPIIGPSSRPAAASLLLAASMASDGDLYAGAGSLLIAARAAFGLYESKESGENGICEPET